MNFGEKLRQLRDGREMTQAETAQHLHWAEQQRG